MVIASIHVSPAVVALSVLAAVGCQAPGDDPAGGSDLGRADVEVIDGAIVDAEPDLMVDAEPDMYPAPDPLRADPGFAQVGSFNIDWLADEYESEYTPRRPADYAMIARLIVETDVEVFGLQEIEGDGALELLGLPDRYAWAVGESGWSQNPAILYRVDRVAIDDVREVRLPDTAFPSKDPLAARVRALDGDLAFTLVVVHFKPFSNTEDATYRAGQIASLHRWITQGLPGAPPPEPPVVVVGDFNETHDGLNRMLRPLEPFEEDERFVFVEEDCPEPSQVRYRSRIDHLVIDAALMPRLMGPGGGARCVVDAFDARPTYADYPDGYRGRSNISGHRPLWMYLTVR